MAHFEEQKGGWPPHDSLAHLATHTPIQVPRQAEAGPGGFHAMQQGAWRVPVPAHFGNFVNKSQPLFGAEWQPQSDWVANNNKLSDWDKWQASAPNANGDVARPLPKFDSITAAMHPLPTTIPATEKAEAAAPHVNYVSPKEEERKSSEHHTNSYDVSASQSPSDNYDVHGERTSEEPIDVECNTNITSSDKIDGNESDCKVDVVDDDAMDTSPPVEMQTSHVNNTEASLLLNFSKQSFTSMLDAARIASPSPSAEEPKKTFGFLQSSTSAFSNIEPSLGSVPTTPVEKKSSEYSPATPPLSSSSSSSSSFCRPPGLGPAIAPPTSNGQTHLVCNICGFSCPSKFHYNSHMNTHGDHQCSMCDYTSRTEGRLKKHMRESHTVEEQLKVGMDVDATAVVAPTSATATATILTSTPMKPPCSDTSNLSSNMASLVDAANAAASLASGSNCMDSVPQTQTLAAALSLDISSPSLLNSLPSNGLMPSALDQIRAFTEKSALLPDGGLNLASALGAVSNAINGDPKTPEKQANSEPRRNSNGKVKVLKCKQCGHQSMSKDEQWAHARTHIPMEKQLNCQHCNFVTEYKHHLEYHYRNHIGSKPFQCKKCAYTCVNKSMLNSHMKSHTNHYQFRCMDCTYATKYCHSLKLHLKKYNHRRVPEGVETNGNSSPTLSRTDAPAYSSFLKLEPPTPSTSLAQSLSLGPIVTSQSLNYASQMLLRHHQMEGINPLLNLNGVASLSMAATKCPICEIQCATQDEQLRHNMSHFMSQNVPIVSLYSGLSQMPSVIASVASMVDSMDAEHVEVSIDERDDGEHEAEVDHDHDHDGSGHAGDDEMEHSSACADSPTGSSKGSGDEEQHKRKAFKLDQISQRLQGKSPSSVESEDKESHAESSTSPSSEPLSNSSQIQLPVAQMPAMSELVAPPGLLSGNEPNHALNFFQQAACMAFNVLQAKRDSEWRFQCPHCRMAFQDQALYHIHMGYHGYEHPFKCNRCGYLAAEPLDFNLHLIQGQHD